MMSGGLYTVALASRMKKFRRSKVFMHTRIPIGCIRFYFAYKILPLGESVLLIVLLCYVRLYFTIFHWPVFWVSLNEGFCFLYYIFHPNICLFYGLLCLPLGSSYIYITGHVVILVCACMHACLECTCSNACYAT